MAFAQRPGAPLVADLQSRRYAHQVGRLRHRRSGDGQQLARPHDQDAQEHHHAQRHDAGEPPAPDGRLLVPHQGLHRDQKDHGHSLQRLRGRNRLPRHARDRRRDEGVAATDDLYRHQRLRRVRGHLRRETLFQGAGRLQLRAAGLQVDLLRAQRSSDARRRQHQLRAGRRHVDHRRRQPLALRGRFLPLQLRLRRPLPARSQRPLRRLVEISEQLPMGLLPLGFGRLARFAGEVLECQPQGRFEPQAARLVRCAGQQQRRSLHLPRNLRPVDLRNRFGRCGPLPLRAGQAALHEPPGLGNLQNLRRRTGRRFPERAAEPHGRLLHPQDGGHVHRRPDASRHLRSDGPQGQLRRHEHLRL